jgi:O-antigen/teichoic acid export membrane protein
MGIIIRQGLKYSSVAYVGVLIGAFNTLWVYPKFLSPEQIGLLRLVQTIGLFVATFVQLGAGHLIDRFFPVFRTEDRTHNGMLPFLLLYATGGFFLFSLVYLLFRDVWLSIYAENSPELNQYFYLIIPLVLFIIYQLVLEAYSRANLRIVIPAVIREVFLKIGTLALIAAYVLQLISFYELIVYLVGVYGLMVLLLLAYLANLKVLHLKLNVRFLNRALLKEMAVYGGYILLGGAGSLIITNIDTLMLGSLLGTREVAIYTIAFFIGTVIEVPRRAISQISTPLLSRAWTENRMDVIEDIYTKSSINQFIAGAFLFLGIWCNVDAIFNLIPNGEIYRPGKYVILFIGLARLFDMATGVNSEIILQSRYFRFNLILTAVLAGLLAATNLIFIPTYGINGAAFATALSVFLYNIIKYLFLWIKFRIQPFTYKTLVLLLIIGITFFSASVVPLPEPLPAETFINIILRSVVITLVFGGLTLLFGVSGDANHLLRLGYQKLRLLFK